jgi:hypothetical protein
VFTNTLSLTEIQIKIMIECAQFHSLHINKFGSKTFPKAKWWALRSNLKFCPYKRCLNFVCQNRFNKSAISNEENQVHIDSSFGMASPSHFANVQYQSVLSTTRLLHIVTHLLFFCGFWILSRFRFF